MTSTDWPALLQRLADRKVDVRRVLQVSRVTLWYWRAGHRKPSGDHAASLIALDRGEEMSRHVNHC